MRLTSILAEGTAGDAAWWIGLGSVCTAIVGALVAGVIKVITAKHEIGQADFKGALTEYEKLLKTREDLNAKLEKRVEDQEAVNDKQAKELQECSIAKARMEERIYRYEELMKAANIGFRPYNPDGEHP